MAKINKEKPAPKAKTHWPAMRYHPESGVGRVFQHESEVPDGFLRSPTWQEKLREEGAEGLAVIHSSTGQDGTQNLGGDPASNKLFVLPPMDEVDKTWIIAQLDARKIAHNNRWGEERLYDLLKDNLDAAVVG